MGDEKDLNSTCALEVLMLHRVVIVGLLLVLVFPMVLAAAPLSVPGSDQQALNQANLYLSAEARKAINDGFTDLAVKVQANDDANHQALDDRMNLL